MEEQIRRIVREEISRAFSAASEVAGNADGYDTDHVESVALGSISKVMERVARDVLDNVHPWVETEHAASTERCTACAHEKHTGSQCGHRLCTCTTMPSTEPVHTITAVPERPKAACTCHRHTHVMGHDDRCGAPFCYCLSPVRARPEHTGVHASTEPPRTCTVCEHGEHDQGKCGMHVYLRGVASPCPCLASRTLGAQRPEGSRLMCTVCENARHGAGQCRYAVPGGACTCSGARS